MDPAAAGMTPEERLAAGLCCECGAPLAGLDVTHHSRTHWSEYIRPDGLNAEAIRRQGLMAAYVPPPPLGRAGHPAPRPDMTKS